MCKATKDLSLFRFKKARGKRCAYTERACIACVNAVEMERRKVKRKSDPEFRAAEARRRRSSYVRNPAIYRDRERRNRRKVFKRRLDTEAKFLSWHVHHTLGRVFPEYAEARRARK